MISVQETQETVAANQRGIYSRDIVNQSVSPVFYRELGRIAKCNLANNNYAMTRYTELKVRKV